MTMSIQSLKSEVLIGAQRTINAQSSQFPLEGRFPRRGYDGEELEIRVRSAVVKRGRYTGADGAGYLVRPGALTIIRVKPLSTRPMYRFTNSDLKLFRNWDQVIQSGGGEQGNAVVVEAGDKLIDIVTDVSLEGREAIHAMYVGALLGEFEYDIGDATITVDYGHHDLSDNIAVNWSDITATIVDDMAAILYDYLQNSGGIRADTAYYNSGLWSTAFAQNTQIKSIIGADPQLSRAFMGVREGLQIVDGDQRFIDPFWGLEWVPIDGPHTLQDDSVVERWPVNRITLTSERQDAKRVLEHSQALDEYTPTPSWMWETFTNKEPKGTFGRYADNGAAAILLPERVQTLDVNPN
jgi:hypothetical protein